MRRFDPQSYLADVLGPYRGSAELPTLFERYLLDFEDADEAAIESRLEEVKRYWDKQNDHPKYGQMIRTLAEGHREATLTLVDAQARAKEVDESRGKQQEAEDKKRRAVEGWERLLTEVVKSAGGLDPARRAQLEKMADRAGIAKDVARAKLDAAPVVAEPEVLDVGVRRVIAADLAALAQGLGEPRKGLSLFHALGLEITDDVEEVRARRAAQVEENNRISHGNAKAIWDPVLSRAKIHLLDSDPSAYVNGLAADVSEALEPEAIRAVADGVIDEVEAEHLQRQALALGLTPELAEQVVVELARDNGAVVRAAGSVDFVACPACNYPHPRDAGDECCRQCGTALFVDCPNNCGQRNDATAARCSSCGTDLHRYAAATRTLSRVAELIDEGRVGQAKDDLAGAVQVLGRSGAEVEAVSRAVTKAVEAAKRAWAEVEAARADRRQYAARRLLLDLAKAAKDFPGPAGELPQVAQSAVAERIGEAESLLKAARKLSGDEREQALVDVLRIAIDCGEAERELDKLPPEPPSEVEAVAGGTGMTIRWTASPTMGVRYAVARTTVPGGVESRVGEASDLGIEDSVAPAGSVVRYSVAATRGRTRSAARTTEPVVVAREVGSLLVRAGDGEVRLSWSPLGDAGRVLVDRREETGAAPVAIASDAAGATDRSVVNGRRYTYLVQVEYPGPGGAVVRTPGQTVFAQPVERPQPLADLGVRLGPSGVSIAFEAPPAGTAVILKCLEDPELAVGSELDPGHLAELGEQLAVRGSAAVDSDPPAGVCFYQPVTVAGAVAIAGAAVRHVALPEIANVRAVANGRKALVTWSWPDGITLARVVWRHDRQPDGPEDTTADSVDYRIGEYRDHGGCSIDTGEHRAFFVSVFPATRAEGEVVYGGAGGKGSRAALRTERKTEVRYSVRCAGRLQKRLEVEVCEPPEGDLPELVLVGREGDILPRTAADGTVLARFGGDDGPRSSSLELRGLARPLAVRLFLDSASAGGSHVLFDPMADDLLIG